MPKVNRDHLFSYKALFPSITEQVEIALKLDQISITSQKAENIYNDKLIYLT